jgi:hypothetical protein
MGEEFIGAQRGKDGKLGENICDIEKSHFRGQSYEKYKSRRISPVR